MILVPNTDRQLPTQLLTSNTTTSASHVSYPFSNRCSIQCGQVVQSGVGGRWGNQHPATLRRMPPAGYFPGTTLKALAATGIAVVSGLAAGMASAGTRLHTQVGLEGAFF